MTTEPIRGDRRTQTRNEEPRRSRPRIPGAFKHAYEAARKYQLGCPDKRKRQPSTEGLLQESVKLL